MRPLTNAMIERGCLCLVHHFNTVATCPSDSKMFSPHVTIRLTVYLLSSFHFRSLSNLNEQSYVSLFFTKDNTYCSIAAFYFCSREFGRGRQIFLSKGWGKKCVPYGSTKTRRHLYSGKEDRNWTLSFQCCNCSKSCSLQLLLQLQTAWPSS